MAWNLPTLPSWSPGLNTEEVWVDHVLGSSVLDEHFVDVFQYGFSTMLADSPMTLITDHKITSQFVFLLFIYYKFKLSTIFKKYEIFQNFSHFSFPQQNFMFYFENETFTNILFWKFIYFWWQ